MTGQHLAWLLLGLGCGLVSAYPWGRWNGRRALDRAWDDGRRDFVEEAADMLGQGYEMRLGRNGPYWYRPEPAPAVRLEAGTVENVPRPAEPDESWVSGPSAGPGHLDWRERTAIELAPETLQGSAALQLDEGPRRDVPRPGVGEHAVELAGPGHPQSAEWSATILAAFYGGGDGLPSLVDVNAGWDAHMAGFERDVRRVDAEITRWAEWARESLTPAWLRAARILEVA